MIYRHGKQGEIFLDSLARVVAMNCGGAGSGSYGPVFHGRLGKGVTFSFDLIMKGKEKGAGALKMKARKTMENKEWLSCQQLFSRGLKEGGVDVTQVRWKMSSDETRHARLAVTIAVEECIECAESNGEPIEEKRLLEAF
jgi:hypothetical protein